MSDFQTALQETLKGVNKAFQAADADLHEEVAAASKAVANVTGGLASLELVVGDENEGGLAYNLTLAAGEQTLPLLWFQVQRKGYPLAYNTLPPTSLRPIPGKQELARVFADMATNPDSPLVTKLAFLLRRHAGEANSPA